MNAAKSFWSGKGGHEENKTYQKDELPAHYGEIWTKPERYLVKPICASDDAQSRRQIDVQLSKLGYQIRYADAQWFVQMKRERPIYEQHSKPSHL